MTHVTTARRERGAKLVVIDPYRTASAEAADLHLAPLPGTDGALACAVMHVLFKEGYADRAYMARYADDPAGLEAHLTARDPEWAAAITGLSEDAIVDFARLYGRTRRSYIRVGYGFSRSRNGSAQLFAVTCLPTVTGAWQYEGGGALQSNHGLVALDHTLHRRARRARSRDPHPRPVAHRPGADRRPARPRRRAAGDGIVYPEHQPDGGRAGIGTGAPGLCPRRSVRLRARAVHDRDRGDGRHRSAGDDVSRARRFLYRRRPHLSAIVAARSCRRMANAARTTMWSARSPGASARGIPASR